ncbi:Coproporphyrinogen dehydrogenase [Catenulispora acidiphila DSM 44928]|uniref:Heme chaperone HemW n=1 Tax=Catenulispora acidiphila (strain DSM 44928 / JCM 14897 / NBRC 102108 / NRRL B-24433 / ID139908) TaxID=479433 RepID=C7Q601_CATAD|nr:STM4012 family radical SAM protein [Catenulispora acidiphila]ACU70098.1 Coproporphyrinogen dehydrogenase [Catenulispora acidiphila DSM 44928]
MLNGPYESYVYAYPHKTAYRPLVPKPLLSDVWRGEGRDALSFYTHIPFCEVRCGFCNLFTRTGAPESLTTAYLDALERQAIAVRAALDESGPAPRFANAAIGGGTPTYLSPDELSRLFDIAEKVVGVGLGAIPLSVEASPATATPDRLTVLAERGTTRLSLGVQSFDDVEARSAVRPQKAADVFAALDAVRAADIPVLNVDLIYGIEGQTRESWRASLQTALRWMPEEIYLYPLYVRPLTGLGRLNLNHDAEWDAQRLDLYRCGRDFLLENGYEQVSMRMFRRLDAPVVEGGEDYACQTDGMIGLGCGARSYTASLHYSFDYAVSASEVRGIIDEYVATTDFSRVEVGYRLDADEQARRFLIQSLLQADGMERGDAVERFSAELALLNDRGFLESVSDRASASASASGADGRLRLTPEGLAWSDAVGPMFFSEQVRAAMRAYELK